MTRHVDDDDDDDDDDDVENLNALMYEATQLFLDTKIYYDLQHSQQSFKTRKIA